MGGDLFVILKFEVKKAYKIFRAVTVSAIALMFLLPAVLYVVLSLPSVQEMMARRAEKELTELLNMKVEIGRLSISPFNRVTIERISISDSTGVKAIGVDRLGAGINLWQYLAHNRIVLDYAEMIGLDARLTRDSVGAPLNIQPMIDALMPKDKTKPPTPFDLRINTVVVRTSTVSYDLLSAPRRASGFDANHIKVSDLRADLQLPRLKNNDFIIDLRRLAMREQSGVDVRRLSGNFHISDRELTAKNVNLQLPESEIRLNDQTLTYNGFDDLSARWKEMPFDIEVMKPSRISTADLVAFVPAVEGLDMVFDLDFHATGTANDIAIERFELRSDDVADISMRATVTGLTAGEDEPAVDLPQLKAKVNAPKVLDAVGRFTTIGERERTIIGNLMSLSIDAVGAVSRRNGFVEAKINAPGAVLSLNGNYSSPSGAPTTEAKINGSLKIDEFDGRKVFAATGLPLERLSSLAADLTFDLTTRKGALPDGTAELALREATYNDISVSRLALDVMKRGERCEATLFADNALLFADVDVISTIGKHRKSLDLSAKVRNLDLSLFDSRSTSGRSYLSVDVTAQLAGSTIDDVVGQIDVDRLTYERSGHDTFALNGVHFEAIRGGEADSLILTSEIVDASVVGQFHLSSIASVGKELVGRTLPALMNEGDGIAQQKFWDKSTNHNRLTYNATIKTLEPLSPLIKLPIGVLGDVRIFGEMDSDRRLLTANIDAPYLSQGNKLIENTAITAGINGLEGDDASGRGYFNFTTTLPTKNGPMTLVTTASAQNDCVDSDIEWKIDRERDFSGFLSLTTCFDRSAESRDLETVLKVNPGQLVFNDTIWTVDPALVTVHGKEIKVEDFRVWRDKQYVMINGRASESPTDTLTLSLNDVNLDYVFETLDIPTAMFGGNVTGDFYATELLTSTPHAFTPKLAVKSLTYNYSLLGDADIRSSWDNSSGGIMLDADILQPNGRRSTISGAIYPLADSLNLAFDCDRIDIGFLKPYMSAFASDVGGYASGHARLYGTFKLIDMTGDVYGEDVSLTLGFTNVTYTTTDSVHLHPGRIQIDNLLLKDRYGKTARLNGWVTHECFKSPRFNFDITGAKDLLVYDVAENTDFQWFGRVFGDGSARVTGYPGMVDISVDMTTARNSTFTYVLSDALSAQEYNFITFRDRDQALKDSIAAINAPPSFVREFRERMAANNQHDQPSKYKMTFNVGITPEALITLVMDPVGGDKIISHGSGSLNMSYDSANEDLRMNGTYTLDDGKYNFTLQDIILKDFIIEPGSSIAFNGDPYAAQLNLTAKYQVKANLTDLDESFLEDKELNRTAVPVEALMMVHGDMRQPEISFDLEFPTLTEDPKRKIRSIINTEDMMNRQIIYLLALGRFYTPDYMNATRGNELVSVASSTISSQLGNILGQLSDNWNIAPNFRSDRGDFSDVEFDVALSSRLLDNRLLLNGNLGYRDKSLNNNSFIGDFDIEYLLNRSGTFRLKAYNRYNDQNYYLKSALTTQGVGLVFKRDFDSLTSWLRPWLRRRAKIDSVPAETIPVETTPVETTPVEAIPAETTPADTTTVSIQH